VQNPNLKHSRISEQTLISRRHRRRLHVIYGGGHAMKKSAPKKTETATGYDQPKALCGHTSTAYSPEQRNAPPSPQMTKTPPVNATALMIPPYGIFFTCLLSLRAGRAVEPISLAG